MKVKFCIASLLLTLTTFAYAAEMRNMPCGNTTVSPGDVWSIVESKCGDPTSKQRFDDFTGGASTETWIYDRSPNGFLYELTFRDGKLSKIEGNRVRS